MRTIKFRAWNMMVHRYEHFTLQDLEGKKNVQWHILTIEKFTGLLDKNGVEIFEGDIVIWNDGGGVCELNPKMGWIRLAVVKIDHDLMFVLADSTPSGTPGHEFHFGNFIYTDTENHLRVIGNIHDNPELLEG